MKNIWKGMAVGAFVGAAIGIAQDGIDGAGRSGRRVAQQAKQAADTVAGKAHDKIDEADIPAKLRHAATAAHDKFDEVSDDLSAALPT